jgi:hypothetical protein
MPNVWLVFRPQMDRHAEWVGPFQDGSTALKAKAERWPWLEVTTEGPDDPDYAVTYEEAAREQDARQ